jgi:hypothetical protein
MGVAFAIPTLARIIAAQFSAAHASTMSYAPATFSA